MFEEFKVNKNSSEPLYYQIMNFIEEDINTDKLKEGDMLPTEMELSQGLAVSRQTIRQAMNELVNKGYLMRVKGRGTFVSKPKIINKYASIIESYSEEMKNKGLAAKTKVLELKQISCEDNIGNKLLLSKGEKVIKLKRLRFAVDESKKQIDFYEELPPLLLTTVYIPYSMIPQLMSYDFECFSLYEVLEKNDLRVSRVVREMEARLAGEKWGRVLKIAKESPVHFISSTGYLESGVPVEYSETIYPGDRNKFLVEIIR